MLVGAAVLIDYDFRIGRSHFRGKGWRRRTLPSLKLPTPEKAGIQGE
jgi:hypothetical protein